MALSPDFGSTNNYPVTRFTSECELCAELLAEYVAASNEVLDTKGRGHSRPQPSPRQLATSLIDNALKRRASARKRLLGHKELKH